MIGSKEELASWEEETRACPESDQEEEIKESLPPIKSKLKTKRKVIVNVSCTKYDVVKRVAKEFFQWRLDFKDDNLNWDLFWTDGAVQPEKLLQMKPYQKINHFPGMYSLARKNFLGKNLNKMRKLYSEDYCFYPKTWLIPSELSDLRNQSLISKNKVYIVKPEASCQGRGIFLTKNLDVFEQDDRYVVQEYLKHPFLIEGLKFDLRLYVLVAGCDPLRIYLHKEGLARFATESYVKPSGQNLAKQCMHLTNYAINKNSENFVFNEDPANDDIGHKRSLTATMKLLEEMGHNTAKLWEDIKEIIIKTLCSVQPFLSHTYRACQPDDPFNGMCFEILGFDIILDKKLKPWLLEVNHSPSFTTDSPLDWKIKFQVISEAMTLLNINTDNKKIYLSKQRQDILKRALGKKNADFKDQKKEEILRAQSKRDRWEKSHLGSFQQIYPDHKEKDYEKFIESAKNIWVESTGRKTALKKEEDRPLTMENNGIKKAVKITPKVKSANRSSSVAYSPIGNSDDRRAASPNVFERLSQIPKKEYIMTTQAAPDPCFRLEQSTIDFSPKPPTPTIDLAIYLEKNPMKLKNKKRHESPRNARLDDILKEKRIFENMKRTLGFQEQPMQIKSVIAADLLDEDFLFSEGKFLMPKIGSFSPSIYRKRQITNKSLYNWM
ncbi:ttll-11_12 [Blepharisma stoltei]|uniref:Tubulin polyglutamylase TTLL6 n=1 Tax=Blepharisma stoltei TaxID=1481888 RepID=A0AAU9JZH3_9CILI|nr:unnamed protein product [Blepharisma stoltei]